MLKNKLGKPLGKKIREGVWRNVGGSVSDNVRGIAWYSVMSHFRLGIPLSAVLESVLWTNLTRQG